MCIAALFLIAKSRPRHPPTGDWMKKKEYYSDTKENEILTFVAKWIELEGIMLSGLIQKDKVSHVLFPIWKLKKVHPKVEW